MEDYYYFYLQPSQTVTVLMYSLTELTKKLSTIVNKKDPESPSIFKDDEENLLRDCIRKFLIYLNQLPSDHILSSSDIVNGLNLKPHPEGGFYRRYIWTKEKSAIFYLLPTGSVSSWHRLKETRETWKWLYGETLNVAHISNDSEEIGVFQLTQSEDVVIDEGMYGRGKWGDWFGAYHEGNGFSLAYCQCTPPFEFAKFELANEQIVNRFKSLHPTYTEIIERLTIKTKES
ncbi:hypothetical protein Bhyg_11294 [Pseudolycoriella hygida]|uniref:DUF985 domain-containing protein n=1 Tax=Pseudolycoriella hygida TaxID=35572 RepID=A0A9Q0MV16_9DIPT|nr:hypothetical protein Bhyg_11294 [Pseudolycoriella hygida]